MADFFLGSFQLRTQPSPYFPPKNADGFPAFCGSPDTSKGYNMSLTLAQTQDSVQGVTSLEPVVQQRAVGNVVRQMRRGEKSRDVVGQDSHLQPICGLF